MEAASISVISASASQTGQEGSIRHGAAGVGAGWGGGVCLGVGVGVSCAPLPVLHEIQSSSW